MLKRLNLHRRFLVGLVAALGVGALLQVTNTNPAVSQTVSISAFELREDPGTDPDSPVWDNVAAIDMPLTAQAGTYIAGGSVKTIRAQAGHYNGRLYVRVAWPDGTQNDSTTSVEDFADAVAIEFPASGKASIPALCMGQADSGVNIWHWRADSNASSRDPGEVYANSQIDKSVSNPAYYTARDAGNPFANPDASPVQTLSSVAFGKLSALRTQDVDGAGKHTADGWTVVFTREFGEPRQGHAAFEVGQKMDMAFAVWDGNNDERNGRKSVSQLVTLRVASLGEGLNKSNTSDRIAIPMAMFFGFTALAVLGASLAYHLDRGRR